MRTYQTTGELQHAIWEAQYAAEAAELSALRAAVQARFAPQYYSAEEQLENLYDSYDPQAGTYYL